MERVGPTARTCGETLNTAALRQLLDSDAVAVVAANSSTRAAAGSVAEFLMYVLVSRDTWYMV